MNDKLRLLRIIKDYKQEAVARVLGINQNTYSRLEQNPEAITAGQAKKLAELYKVEVEDILSSKILVISFGSEQDRTPNPEVVKEIDLLRQDRDFLRCQNQELLKLISEKVKRLESETEIAIVKVNE